MNHFEQYLNLLNNTNLMNKITTILVFLSITLIAACTYVQKVRDGQTAFDVKQYKVAIPFLKKDYDKAKISSEKGKIAYMLGESYNNLNNPLEAIDWYKRAYDNQYEPIEALKNYAFALKATQQYEDAHQAFKELGIEIGSPYEYRKEMTACKVAIEWTEAKEKEYSVKLLDFNSGFADYSPTLYKNNQLVFTSDRTSAAGEEKYNWTGNDFSDLFVVDLKSNIVEAFDTKLNTPLNEGTVTFSRDFSEVYFTRCFGDKRNDFYCKLMVSKIDGDSWSEPKVLDFVKDNINYGHPTLSEDGSTLYFSCNDDEGWGGYDIYMVERTPDGWGTPILMSRSINTIGNEMFPYIDKDTLYFSSDAHTGMGGLDIFRTYRMGSDWTPVFNLKSPINSGADDFGYAIDYEAPKRSDILEVGYFSSTRDNGAGNDDIYRFEKRPLPPPPPIEEGEEPEPIVYKMILNGYILEKIYADPGNPDSKVLGRKPLNNARVQVNFNGKTENFTVGEDGLFTMELKESMDYNFFASKEEYLNNENRFSTKGIGKDPKNPVLTFEVEIELDRIFRDREIVLEDIYYDFDRWFIRDDAKPTLDALTRALQLNPDRKIQLSSHTDCRGNDNYNQSLSQKRAQSAVDYLISKGIDPNRLTAVGYGENALRVDCACSRCSEEEHQANRRTTFKFVE